MKAFLLKVENLFKENGKTLHFTLLVSSIFLIVLYGMSLMIGFRPKYYLLLIIFFIPFLTHLLYKDFMEDKARKGSSFLLKTLFLFILILLNHSLFMQLIDSAKTPKTRGFFKQMMLLADVFVIGFTLYYFKSKKFKEAESEINDNHLWDRITKREEEVSDGDVILCYDPDTNAPVYWLYEDRFLHMLVLGPTGSGKTSQILTPLVNQDLQNREVGVTVIEPKGDWAEEVSAMAEYHGRGDETVYFNPIMRDCPSFNPLFGREADVIEDMTTTFNSFSEGSSAFFLDMNETLVRNSLRILKRMKGNHATLIDFYRLIHNSGGYGVELLTEFSRMIGKGDINVMKENEDLISWFRDDYLSENSKTYEHCSGLRSQVSKLISNTHLRRVLNPLDGKSDVDFEKHLREGTVVAISTAQGELRDLSRFLGYFIILQFQSAVFQRPGNKDTRRGHFLYIDEFQTYANKSFENMLTQGRSYRVASHLATQNRALIGANSGRDGKAFIEMVSTNARNVVIFPGGNAEDAKFYSEQFGEDEVIKEQVGITRQKFNPLRGGFKTLNYDSESIREVEEMEVRFTTTDIIERPFGEMIYRLIKRNSIQQPQVGKVRFIDYEIKQYIDKRVEEFHAEIEAFNSELSSSNIDYSSLQSQTDSAATDQETVRKQDMENVDDLSFDVFGLEDDEIILDDDLSGDLEDEVLLDDELLEDEDEDRAFDFAKHESEAASYEMDDEILFDEPDEPSVDEYDAFDEAMEQTKLDNMYD